MAGAGKRTFSPGWDSALSTTRTPPHCAYSFLNAAKSAHATPPVSPSNSSERSQRRSRTRAKWHCCLDSPAPRHRAPVHRHRLHRLCGRPEPVDDRRTTSHHPALSTRHARCRPVHARSTDMRVSPNGCDGGGAAVHEGPGGLRTDALDRSCHRQRRRGRPARLARARAMGKHPSANTTQQASALGSPPQSK